MGTLKLLLRVLFFSTMAASVSPDRLRELAPALAATEEAERDRTLLRWTPVATAPGSARSLLRRVHRVKPHEKLGSARTHTHLSVLGGLRLGLSVLSVATASNSDECFSEKECLSVPAFSLS